MADSKSRASGEHLSNLGVKAAGVASSILVAKIFTYLIAGVALIVVSRLLASTLYGIYVLVSSVSGIFVSFGSLGISTAFSKFIAEYRAKRQQSKINEVISSGYFVTLAIGLMLTAIMFGLSALISHLVFSTAQYSSLISIGSVLVIGSLLFSISFSALIGFGKKNTIIIVTLIQITVQAVVSITLAWYHFGVLAPITGVALGYFSGTVATLAYMARTERVKVSLPSWASIKKLMVFSLPLGVYNLVTGISGNLANLILGVFANPSVVGNVAISQKMGTTINSANDSVSASLIPLFASAVEPGVKRIHLSKLYNYSLYITFVLFAPISFYLAFFSKEIVYIALGTGYPTAQFYLPIVSIGLMLMMASDYTTSLLVGRDKVKPIMTYGTVAYVIEILVLLLLVPTFKGYGMVVTVSLLLPATLLLFYHKAVADRLGIKLHVRRILQVVAIALIATLAVIPIALLIRPVSLANDIAILVATAAVFVVIYPPLLTITRTMVGKDIMIIKKTSSGIPWAGRILYHLSDYAEMFARGRQA